MNNKIQIARLLRKNQTKAEKKLWSHLRNRKLKNLKFRRQHPIKSYIVDFFCVEYGIIIELDGEYHKQINQAEKDRRRDIHLQSLGYKILRFENRKVFENVDIVFQYIIAAKEKQESYASERKEHLKKHSENTKKHLTPSLTLSRGSSITVLSTKILSPSQKELFLHSGLGLVEYNALDIEFLDVPIPNDFQNYIFTSKNAVKAFLKHFKKLDMSECNAFCVGEKTKAVLEENGLKIIATTENALDLGDFIIKKHQNEKFLFLCGNLRREELPSILSKNNVRYTEVKYYKTHLIPRKFDRVFDGLLFFSPSGIKSYVQENSISKSLAFCIGNTTATEAKKYTDQIIIANKPTIENVLVQAIKYFKKHD